jgi:hypothetical protein
MFDFTILDVSDYDPPHVSLKTWRVFILPISATMLRKIKEYDETLELFSGPLLPLLDFELDSDDGRMEVRNETAVHYKYIDMTAIAERLFGFIQDTIENELVSELDFVLDYDKAKFAIRSQNRNRGRSFRTCIACLAAIQY